jgi:hypothetical protein
MVEFITVVALSLESVFSGGYRFRLPWFQRSYAWRTEHAGRLLADIIEAMGSKRRRYFLGHLRLAQKPGDADAALIDGQQRIITLTILFALLRDLLPPDHVEDRRRLDSLVWRRAGPRSAIRQPATLHVEPQPSIAEFLRRYVQAEGGTTLEPEEEIMSLPPAARNILENRNHLRAMLQDPEMSAAQREELTEFILTRCAVIVESVGDEDEAWSMLAKEEDTGLGFHSSEGLRVSIISAMPVEEQEEAGRKWDREMAGVAADDATALLGQIRAMIMRRRSTRPLEQDLIRESVLDRTGRPFLDDIFVPSVRGYLRLRSGGIATGRAGAEAADPIATLWWLQHQHWVAPVLTWLRRRGNAHPGTAAFLRRLDRLAWLMRLAALDPTEQEKRFIRLVGAIDRAGSADAIPALEIETKLRSSALENLRSPTFYAKHFCGLVMRRLSRIQGHDHGPVGGADITVEHVLPRNAEPGRAWHRSFPRRELINQNVNRLGNLALLSLKQNEKAGTLDYPEKRAILRASGFALSVAAAESPVWTPATIEQRTEALIKQLFDAWELEVK